MTEQKYLGRIGSALEEIHSETGESGESSMSENSVEKELEKRL